MKYISKTFHFKAPINIYGKLINQISGIIISLNKKEYRLPFININDKDERDALELIMNNWKKIKDENSLSKIKSSHRLKFYIDSIFESQNGKQYTNAPFFQLVLNHKEISNLNAKYCKFKVNKSNIDSVDQVIKKNPSTIFRLDGNQQLGAQHISKLNLLYSKYKKQIEFIEEPFSDSSLYLKIEMPIAYDESLSFESIKDYQKIIILKPVLIGTILENISIIDKYVDKRFILSSFYEPLELYSGYQTLIDYLQIKKGHELHGLSTYKYWEY